MSKLDVKAIPKHVDQLLAEVGDLPSAAESAVEKLLNLIEALVADRKELDEIVEAFLVDLPVKRLDWHNRLACTKPLRIFEGDAARCNSWYFMSDTFSLRMWCQALRSSRRFGFPLPSFSLFGSRSST